MTGSSVAGYCGPPRPQALIIYGYEIRDQIQIGHARADRGVDGHFDFTGNLELATAGIRIAGTVNPVGFRKFSDGG